MPDQTIVKTTYRGGGAGNLLDYIGREGSPLRDHSGERITESQRERFIEKSESHNFERDMIISPANGNDLSDREFHRGTRRTMDEFVKGRPTASYVYTVHDDTEHKHAHVALTGERRELYLDRDDLDETRELAHESYLSRDLRRDRDLDLDRDRDGIEPRRSDPDDMSPLEARQREEHVRRKNEEQELDRERDPGMGWGR